MYPGVYNLGLENLNGRICYVLKNTGPKIILPLYESIWSRIFLVLALPFPKLNQKLLTEQYLLRNHYTPLVLSCNATLFPPALSCPLTPPCFRGLTVPPRTLTTRSPPPPGTPRAGCSTSPGRGGRCPPRTRETPPVLPAKCDRPI